MKDDHQLRRGTEVRWTRDGHEFRGIVTGRLVSGNWLVSVVSRDGIYSAQEPAQEVATQDLEVVHPGGH